MKFIDLSQQYLEIKGLVDKGIQRVLDHGQFIMGPEVFELETALSQYCGAAHCISCNSGTDAILMALMAIEIEPNDAVFLPSFTFIATAEPVALLGATPVFTDIEAPTNNMSAASLANAIERAIQQGLTPKAAIAVDMHGRPADYEAIRAVTNKYDLVLIGDAAQSFGGYHPNGKVGTLADMTCVSFFPGKPFGCYGDGGAVFTDNEALADVLSSIRVHGKGDDKYDNIRVGLNSRLDTIQAAVLLAKLTVYPEEMKRRQVLAERYATALPLDLQLPLKTPGYQSTHAYYSVVAASQSGRQQISDALKQKGIPTGVYYPKPLHLQKVFSTGSSLNPDGCAVSADISSRSLSLPFHPYMSNADFEKIIQALHEAAF